MDNQARNKLKHLELIQGIINRMGNNSFLLKGWSVILVSGLFALAATGSNLLFVYLAYFPAISFSILDGYFLWQERLFRRLYDDVRRMENKDIDFSMDTSPFAPTESWLSAILSKTLLIFHGTIILTIIIVMIVSIILIESES